MKVKINQYIPFHGFVAMAFYNIVIFRKEYDQVTRLPQFKDKYELILNHESIHEALMKDFCRWIPIGGTIFYIIYFFEWLFRLLFTKAFMSKKAYSNISFEKEAKSNEKNLDYLKTRKHFALWK